MTSRPSARATFNGLVVGRLLTTGVPSITKIWVAPESAMEDGRPISGRSSKRSTGGMRFIAGQAICGRDDLFDVWTVMSSSGRSDVNIV